MRLRLQREWLLLAPMVLAYVLKRANSGVTLLPVFILAGALYLLPSWRGRKRLIPISLIFPFALFFLWSWVALFGGAPLDIFLFFYSRLCLYLIVGIFIFQFTEASISDHFEWGLLVLGFMEAILIVVAAVRLRYIDWPGLQWEGYLGNPLHSGILLPAALGVALVWMQRERQSRLRIAALLVVVLALVSASFFIRSRSAILAIGALLLYLYPRKLTWIGIASAIFVVIWIFFQNESFLLFFEFDPFSLESTISRFSIWATALDAIRARPILGYGLGNFEMAYRLFQHPSHEILRYGKSTLFAHNALLQMAAETGVPGTLLLIWGFGGLMKRAAPLFFKERALFSIVIVFFVTSLFNYSLFHPFNGLIFTAAVALLATKASGRNNVESVIDLSKVRLLPTFMIVSLSIFLVSFGISEALQKNGRLQAAVRVCPIRSEAWYDLALKNIRESKNFLPTLDRALIWNPQNSFYWQRKALVLANFLPLEEEKINQCFKRAQLLSPHHAPFYIEEAFYRIQKKQWRQARHLFEIAASLEPIVPLPHYGLALIDEQEGNRVAAKSEMDLVYSLKNQQKQLEENLANGWMYLALFNSEYGRFLFGVK